MSKPAEASERVVIPAAEEAGERIDRLLAAHLPDISRSRLKALIQAGCVTSGGRTLGDPAERVKPGEVIVVNVPEPKPAAPVAETIPLAVVHEDAHLIVIDKPAGLVVHPAAGHGSGTLVNALIAHCGDSLSGISGVRRPGIVHRLDKETSGLLVVAKSDAAHQGLARQFAAHGRDGRMRRAYVAFAWGVPQPPRGRIEARLGRHPTQRTRMAVVRGEAGRHAATRYTVEERYGDVAARVRLELETGRTHQIRVHFAHIGHPLLGDAVYGQGFKSRAARLPDGARAALAALGRQALHAAELGFAHPVTGEALHFVSPLPADLARLEKELAAFAENATRKPNT